MVGQRDTPEWTHYTTEAPVVCFDFSKFPEVLAGGTLSNPVMATVSNVTFSGTAVLTAEFAEGATSGAADVQAGKGVSTKITCTVAGRYELTCTVDIAITVNGSPVTVPRSIKLNLVVE